ncbi:multi-sensor hybrid histidine kinase [Candidatus Magnetomorum sp. HK-1]|nr:multi-sensor hybrid histidine kinase [Candidatus Magnetomorum sp. HK-1]
MDNQKLIFYSSNLSKNTREELQAKLNKLNLSSFEISENDLIDNSSLSSEKLEISPEDFLALLNQFNNQKNQIQDLQQKVDLTLRRVAQLKQSAKKADIAKSQFFTNMSHEIRTPLNAIIGMTDLLLDTHLNTEQIEYADTVKTATKSLHYFVKELLDFSKIETEELDIEIIDFDFRVAIEEVVDLYAARAFSKGLEFSCMIDHRIPSMLRGDPARLRQIISHLSDNAIKFTEKGSVNIDVKFMSEHEQLVGIQFDIADTGIGIRNEDMEKILTPFSQADSSDTRIYGGIGIGLTLSRRLIDLMDGAIEISSKPGQGTIVTVHIKFDKQRPVSEEVSTCAELAGKNFLIVDNNITNRHVLREMLRLWSCKFDEVETGEQAKEILKAKNNPYDAVILDMILPDMKGSDLIRYFKEDDSYRNIKTLMITSMGQRGDGLRMKKLGLSAYLTRPVLHSVLHDALAELVNAPDTSSLPEHDQTLITKYSVQENKKQRLRILLVEDSIVNQQIATKIIEKLGFRVDIASNGEECLSALEKKPYDIVFMDVQMPVMDGLEATRNIRQGTRKAINTEVPVVAMTAHTLPGIQKEFTEVGMNDAIIKPIHPDEILKYIKKYTGISFPLKNHAKEEPKVSSIYDRKALLDRLDGDEDLCKDIINDFFNDIPDLSEALRTGIKQNNQDIISSIAFTIKEGASDIASEPLMEICDQIETAGLANDMEKANDLLNTFQDLMNDFSNSVNGNKALPKTEKKTSDYLILVVEDEKTNQKLMERLLKKHNYTFEIVENGLDAIEAMKSAHYDLVFMDVQLPGMDGMETTRRIRSIELDIINPKVPIIGVSAHTLEEDKALFISAGMDDFIEKPIKQELLFQKLEQYMPSQQQSENTTALFDYEELMDRIGNDQAVYESTVRFFKTHVVELLEQAKTAVNNRNPKEIESIGHTIKGVAANMSAKAIAETALELEYAGKENRLEKTDDLIKILNEQFEAVQKCF